jgi:hypothetical protein
VRERGLPFIGAPSTLGHRRAMAATSTYSAIVGTSGTKTGLPTLPTARIRSLPA